MKVQKRLLLVFILSITALIMVACSLFPPASNEPTVGDTPPVTADQAVSGTPHGVEGAFADCMTCHSDAEAVHEASWWDLSSCIDCHQVIEGSEGVEMSLGTITLPGNHESPAFADCSMCHAGGLDSIPHALDNDYADCASCHTVEYEIAPAGEEPANGEPATGGLSAITLPGDHNNAAYANCSMCHAAGLPSIPHALTGAYADCKSCHTVNYAAATPAAPAAPADPAPAAPAAPADPAPAPAPAAPVAGPLTLSAAHAGFGTNCLMCHTDGASLTKKPIHALDATYANCAACHAIN